MPDNRADIGRGAFLILLAAITGLGALLRLATLGAHDLWLDELLTLRTLALNDAWSLWLSPSDPTPPLYYWLTELLVGETGSEAALRSVSAAAGIAAVALAGLLGRRLGGPVAGLAAALFLAVSGPHIEYSQEARAYALAFLGLVGAATGLAGHLRGGAGLGLFFAGAVVAVYSHLSTLFTVAAFCLLLLGWTLRSGRPLWPALRVALGCGVGALPALAMTLGPSAEVDWLVQASPSEALATLREVGFSRGDGAWLGVALVLFAAALPGLVALRRRPAAAVVVAGFALGAVMVWAIGFWRPVFMFRTALPFLMAPLLLWSLGAAVLPSRTGAAFAAGVAALLLGSHLAYERSEAAAVGWRDAAAFVGREGREGDAVLLCRWNDYPPMRFYSPDGRPLPFAGVIGSRLAALYPAPAAEKGNWIETYNPNVAPRIDPAGLAGARPAGSTVWIIEWACGEAAREALGHFVAATGAEPEPAWRGRGIRVQALRF